MAQEFLVGSNGLGFPAGLFKELTQVKVRQRVREKTGQKNRISPESLDLECEAQVTFGFGPYASYQIGSGV